MPYWRTHSNRRRPLWEGTLLALGGYASDRRERRDAERCPRSAAHCKHSSRGRSEMFDPGTLWEGTRKHISASIVLQTKFCTTYGREHKHITLFRDPVVACAGTQSGRSASHCASGASVATDRVARQAPYACAGAQSGRKHVRRPKPWIPAGGPRKGRRRSGAPTPRHSYVATLSVVCMRPLGGWSLRCAPFRLMLVLAGRFDFVRSTRLVLSFKV